LGTIENGTLSIFYIPFTTLSNFLSKGPSIIERASVLHKGSCVIRIVGVCCFYLEEELVLPLNQGICP